ncbi:hypothetical protein [Pseudorhodoferax sp.]|uniref:hypothetical protein n=1 Tax=Pseudorhodoferax sp. TaxID=1993553 RepID=UPI0039E5A282
MLKRLSVALFAMVAVVLAGCASSPTSLDAQWVNPQFAGKKPVDNVMVMAATKDATNRRLIEDRMVQQLSGQGVKAVQSYKFLARDGEVTQEQLRAVVTQAGVSYALVSRVTNVSSQVNVDPGMVMGPAWGPGWGAGMGWGPGWGGWAGYWNTMWAPSIPPSVTTTQNVHVDTRLLETKDATVIWSAATTTSAGYNSMPELVNSFVQVIVQSMQKDGVI